MIISKDAKIPDFLKAAVKKDISKRAVDEGAPVFLRDLNPQLQKETLEDIKVNKPELFKSWQENTDEDIVVGYYIDLNDYKLWHA